jgi:hypothetical protein
VPRTRGNNTDDDPTVSSSSCAVKAASARKIPTPSVVNAASRLSVAVAATKNAT